MRKIFLFLLVCLAASGITAQIYVVETSGGAHNGTSWADAYIDLQAAIHEASAGDTIWVAEGYYRPSIDTLGALHPIPERRSFWLKNGVVVYGGFNGTETSLSQRDPIHLKAILEGEFSTGINAEHVLNVYSHIDSTAVLDGFIVQHGKSINTSTEQNGSGMLLRGDAQFYNVVFRNNETYTQGGAIYGEYTNSLFVNCRFQSNQVVQYDGAACNLVYSDVRMYNCVFDGNQAGRFGGAITTVESDLLVQNGTFFANSAGNNVFQFSTSGDIRLKNCLFGTHGAVPNVMGSSGANVSFVDGLMPMDNNWLILCPNCIGATPTYTNLGAGDYSLAAGSRGIDETLSTTPVNDYDDHAGNPRLVGSSMDMGAFEYQGAVGIAPVQTTAAVGVHPNPATEMLHIDAPDAVEAVAILNLAGQVVQVASNDRFTVSELPAGLYFARVTTAKGIAVVRFVKE